MTGEKTIAPEPPELAEEIFAVLEEKAGLPVSSMILLGMLAGVYVGLGGLFATRWPMAMSMRGAHKWTLR